VKHHQEAGEHDEQVDAEVGIANDGYAETRQNVSVSDKHPQCCQAAQAIEACDAISLLGFRHQIVSRCVGYPSLIA
jgi:hypothetical protein